MKRVSVVLALAVAFAGACTKSNDKASVDSALSIGATTPGFDSLSTQEQVPAASLAPGASGSQASAPRTSGSTVRRSSSGSSGSSGSYGGNSTASSGTSSSSGGTVTIKHPKRDAEIGAAAGAIIGATTSKNKIGGAVIGGVVGGVIGGVIGNNVDKTKKKKD